MNRFRFFNKHRNKNDKPRHEAIKQLKNEIKTYKMQYNQLLIMPGKDNYNCATEDVVFKENMGCFFQSDYQNRSYDIAIVSERVKLAAIIDKQEKELNNLEKQEPTLINQIKKYFFSP